MKSNLSDLIRKYYSTYQSNDRKALEDLLSDDFTFSRALIESLKEVLKIPRAVIAVACGFCGGAFSVVCKSTPGEYRARFRSSDIKCLPVKNLARV